MLIICYSDEFAIWIRIGVWMLRRMLAIGGGVPRAEAGLPVRGSGHQPRATPRIAAPPTSPQGQVAHQGA